VPDEPRQDYGPGAPPARALTTGLLALAGLILFCLCYGLCATAAELLRAAIQAAQ